MRIYSIFDDFDLQAIELIKEAGGFITIHPVGVPRPDHNQMKKILEEYDCIIIGTSQRITEDMFDNINSPRIIATASVGVDHISIPRDKCKLVTIINTPKANAQSVAEFTIGSALLCAKRFIEGYDIYKDGKDNKSLHRKPEDLSGKVLGIIGAGNISQCIINYALFFGMRIICWTRNPAKHIELEQKNVQFVSLETLVKTADVISVNLPSNVDTKRIISSKLVDLMKPIAIFISVSRIDVVDYEALLKKAESDPNFYVCLDIDVNDEIKKQLPLKCSNVLITPHVAGGTIETRKRMFVELAEHISTIILGA